MRTNNCCKMNPAQAAWVLAFVLFDPSLSECDRGRIVEWWNADQKEDWNESAY